MIGGIMSMMGGGGPMGMINQLMQSMQQQTQQSGESDQCSQGGGQNDPAQMFQQILQQMTQGGG